MSVNSAQSRLAAIEEEVAELESVLRRAELPAKLASAARAVTDQMRRVRAAAAEPFRIGLIGEFGAGKTLLAASLLGTVDGLVFGDSPTTGNVTTLQLRQSDPGDRTSLVGRRVHFMTWHDVRQQGETLLEHLQDCWRRLGEDTAATSIGRPGCLSDLADRLRVGTSGWDVHALDDLLDWVTTTPVARRDLTCTRIVWLVLSLGRAFAQHGNRLGTVVEDLVVDDLKRYVVIPERAQDTNALAGIEADPFWLVHHVEFCFSVPPTVLDLTDLVPDAQGRPDRPAGAADQDRLATHAVEIVDCPGIQNDVARERDSGITRAMLEEVDLVLVLLKAGNVAAPAGDELSDLLRGWQNNKLVCIGNLFDLPGTDRFLALASTASKTLDDRDVFEAVDGLRALMERGRQLGGGRQPRLYSGLAALEHQQIGTDRFGDRYHDAGRRRKACDLIVEQLSPSSQVATALRPICLDGGRAALVTAIQRELQVHGLPRREERAVRERDALRDVREDLADRIEQHLRDTDVTMSSQWDVRPAVREFLATLKDRVPDALAAGDARLRDELSCAARAVAAEHVMRWPVWGRMLRSARGVEVLDGPANSGELLAAFVESCREAASEVERDLLGRWEGAVLRLARELRSDRVGDFELAAEQWTDEPVQIQVVLTPDRWRGILTAVPGGLPVPARPVADVFPLRHPWRLEWSQPGLRTGRAESSASRNQRHLGFLIRLRFVLVEACAEYCLDHVDALRTSAVHAVLALLDRMIGTVEGLPAPAPAGDDAAAVDLQELVVQLRGLAARLGERMHSVYDDFDLLRG